MAPLAPAPFVPTAVMGSGRAVDGGAEGAGKDEGAVSTGESASQRALRLAAASAGEPAAVRRRTVEREAEDEEEGECAPAPAPLWGAPAPTARKAACKANCALAGLADAKCRHVSAGGTRCQREPEVGEEFCAKHTPADDEPAAPRASPTAPAPARARKPGQSPRKRKNAEQTTRNQFDLLFPTWLQPPRRGIQEHPVAWCHWCHYHSPTFARCKNFGKEGCGGRTLPCPRQCPMCVYLNYSSYIDADTITTPEELKERWCAFTEAGCPMCRGICSCRACLRAIPGRALAAEQREGTSRAYYEDGEEATGEFKELEPAERKAFATHVADVLAQSCVPAIASCERAAAAAYDNLKPGVTRQVNPLPSGERATCDACQTAIWGDYYCAPSEGGEICPLCFAERVEEAGTDRSKCLALADYAPARLQDPEHFALAFELVDKAAADGTEAPCVAHTLPPLPLPDADLQRGAQLAEDPALCVKVAGVVPGEPGSPEVDPNSDVILASIPEAAREHHATLFAPSLWQMRNGIDGSAEPTKRGKLEAAPQGARAVERTNPAMLAAFHKRWELGEPMLIRRCAGRMSWSPRALQRMAREKRHDQARAATSEITVIRCSDLCELSDMAISNFFRGYLKGGFVRNNGIVELLKLKDWPSEGTMHTFAPRHTADFYELCPVPEFTNTKGPLNLASYFPASLSQPDLGPKCYIAYGCPDEAPEEGKHELDDRGDSVTKMHYDMADAVNVLLHVQSEAMMKSANEGGIDLSFLPGHHDEVGAVWDLFHRSDAKRLEDWIREKAAHGRWSHGPQKLALAESSSAAAGARKTEWRKLDGSACFEADSEVPMDHAIHDQVVFLRKADLELLKKETGIEPWRIYQREGDAVFVPARCPHQVRNLRPCVKVAVDFVSPENMQYCVELSDDFRQLGMDHKHKEDVLQSRGLAMHTYMAARELNEE